MDDPVFIELAKSIDGLGVLDTAIRDDVLDSLESQTTPTMQCVVNLLQIYVAVFKDYVGIVHKKSTDFDAAYTNEEKLGLAVLWWSMAKEQTGRAKLRAELLAKDKQYYLDARNFDEAEKALFVAFIETYKELHATNTVTNPRGIVDGRRTLLSFGEIVLAQTLFALKDRLAFTE